MEYFNKTDNIVKNVNFVEINKIKKFFFEEETFHVNLDDITDILGRQKKILDETKKRKNFSYQEAGKVWRNIYGKEFDKVKCKICNKEEISFDKRDEWHISHVKSLKDNGGNDLDNLRPACKKCNLSMRTKNMIDYCREKYGQDFETIAKNMKFF